MAVPMDSLALEMEFTRFLAARKFRKTPERFSILRKAVQIGSHFEVDTLHQAIENDGYHVSRATVYNTVELLHEAGILRRNLFDGSAATYEIRRDNHIHLICRCCGSILEVDDGGIAGRVMSLHPAGFRPDSFSVTVHGLCRDCSPDEPSMNRPESTQLDPTRSKSIQIESNRAKSSQIESNRAKSSQIEPNRVKSSQIELNRAKSK